MVALLTRITDEERNDLRQRFAGRDDRAWVSDLARREGWAEANRRYLEAVRERGEEEMASLMVAAGAMGPPAPDAALDLIALAHEVFVPEARVERETDEGGAPVLVVTLAECPTYAYLERTGWHGVTACSSWHRRQGWYDALGIEVEDSVVAEKKWGDVACVARIKLTAA
jgi:hypothetical protein